MHKAATRHNGHAHSRHHHHLSSKDAKKFLLAQYKKMKSRPVVTTEVALGIGIISVLALWLVFKK